MAADGRCRDRERTVDLARSAGAGGEHLEDPAPRAVGEGEQERFPLFLIRFDTYHLCEISYAKRNAASSPDGDEFRPQEGSKVLER
jgi:hypothetical protein